MGEIPVAVEASHILPVAKNAAMEHRLAVVLLGSVVVLLVADEEYLPEPIPFDPGIFRRLDKVLEGLRAVVQGGALDEGIGHAAFSSPPIADLAITEPGA